MYAAVGSYMARVIRIFAMVFAPYPPFWTTVVLATAIYVNFFAHHFLPDIRLVLFAATVLLYARTRVWFRIDRTDRWMPLPLAALLSALALWLAENVGTATGTWLYSGQMPGQTVSFAKFGSWYLLLYVAFVTVTLVTRRALSEAALAGLRSDSARLVNASPGHHPSPRKEDAGKTQARPPLPGP
jgi:uncharacterized membrane protein YoaT (DUF817 family)